MTVPHSFREKFRRNNASTFVLPARLSAQMKADLRPSKARSRPSRLGVENTPRLTRAARPRTGRPKTNPCGSCWCASDRSPLPGESWRSARRGGRNAAWALNPPLSHRRRKGKDDTKCVPDRHLLDQGVHDRGPVKPWVVQSTAFAGGFMLSQASAIVAHAAFALLNLVTALVGAVYIIPL